MNKKPHITAFPEVIGQNIPTLLEQIDTQVADPLFRDELKHSLRQLTDLKFALDESSIVAVTDRHGVILYVNDTFCRISKYTRAELLGRDHRLINSGYHDKSFFRELWNTIIAGKIWRGDIKNQAKDGSFYWVHTTIVPFLDPDGKPYQFLAVRNEVTELKRAEDELKQMVTKVIHIQEEERKRFSRELHDGISQSLFSLLIQLDRIISAKGNPELEQLRRNVSATMGEVRNMAWELRPAVLDDLGVVPAIRTYIENFTQHYAIQVEFDSKITKRLDIRVETVFYRIIQEALTNLGKYANVAHAFVKLIEYEGRIEAQIIDYGVGFECNRNKKGIGLFSMEERARSIGGQLHIQSSPGQGTCVKLILPLPLQI